MLVGRSSCAILWHASGQCSKPHHSLPERESHLARPHCFGHVTERTSFPVCFRAGLAPLHSVTADNSLTSSWALNAGQLGVALKAWGLGTRVGKLSQTRTPGMRSTALGLSGTSVAGREIWSEEQLCSLFLLFS